MFRAIATDLDGTLLRSDSSVSDRTRNAVHAAEDSGLLFVVATGRPPRWIAPIVEALGDRGLVVCANGASVYDPAAHEIVEATELDPAVVEELIDDLDGILPKVVYGVEQQFDYAIDEAVHGLGVDPEALWPGVRVGPIRSFLDRPVTKLIARTPSPARPGLAAEVQEALGDRALVTHSTDESFLEISRPDVHKAATVERLLERSGIFSGEVVSFGDMPNDIELLRWSGLGVAVANAAPSVRDAADEVTASNDDDGVAQVIERILESGS
ncbi:MAG: HAD family hydrolase [Acidimicrobiales bacterium]|nr:HAD family hydrolase [Acidimicrobiales bacterium]